MSNLIFVLAGSVIVLFLICLSMWCYLTGLIEDERELRKLIGKDMIDLSKHIEDRLELIRSGMNLRDDIYGLKDKLKAYQEREQFKQGWEAATKPPEMKHPPKPTERKSL